MGQRQILLVDSSGRKYSLDLPWGDGLPTDFDAGFPNDHSLKYWIFLNYGKGFLGVEDKKEQDEEDEEEKAINAEERALNAWSMELPGVDEALFDVSIAALVQLAKRGKFRVDTPILVKRIERPSTWIARVDATTSDSHIYYYNYDGKRSQWEKPDDFSNKVCIAYVDKQLIKVDIAWEPPQRIE